MGENFPHVRYNLKISHCLFNLKKKKNFTQQTLPTTLIRTKEIKNNITYGLLFTFLFNFIFLWRKYYRQEDILSIWFFYLFMKRKDMLVGSPKREFCFFRCHFISLDTFFLKRNQETNTKNHQNTQNQN